MSQRILKVSAGTFIILLLAAYGAERLAQSLGMTLGQLFVELGESLVRGAEVGFFLGVSVWLIVSGLTGK